MDTTNLLNTIYKQELADAMEQKVLFRAQFEISQQNSKAKDKTIQELKNEITELRNEVESLRENLNDYEEEGE